ncbi:PAS domain S-box protein [Candidatus Poribacteria bacterium]|nr:PAS domain S-box protein [Candidatus Poribacteria bacterium]
MEAQRPLQLLLLEDNQADVEIVLDSLRRSGVALEHRHVWTRAQFAAELDAAPDVIVSDYHLPQFDALQALRLMTERGLDIPFIVVTGHLSDEEAVACLRAGASDFLLKDRLHRLPAAIETALELASSRARLRDERAAHDRERALLNALFEGTPDLVYFKDIESRFTRLNSATASLLGVENPADAIGKTDFDFFDAETARRSYADEQRLLRTGEAIRDREELLDGEDPGWLLTTKVPLRDASGKIVGLAGIAKHITELKRVQRALQREQSLLTTLIDNLPDLVYFKDAQGRFARVNRPKAAQLGHDSPNEVTGKLPSDFYAPERAQRYIDADSETIRDGRARLGFEEQLPNPAPDGPERWYQTSNVPVHGSDGASVGIVGIARDITERKAVEEALRESEERFRTVVSSMSDIIFTLDREGRHTAVYGNWVERSGLTPETFIGRTARDVLGPEAARVHDEANARALRGETVVYEWSALVNSQMRHYQTSLSPLRDARGEVTGLVGVGRDITALRQAQEEVLSTHARLEAILSSSPLPILVGDLEGRITTWSPAAERLFGWTADEAAGRRLLTVPPGLQAEFVELAARNTQYGEVTAEETTRMAKDGRLIPVRVTRAPLRAADGAIAGIVAIVEDVSERRASEQQLRLLSSAVERTADAVIIADTAGAIQYVNPATERITRYTRAELIGRNPRILSSGEHNAAFYADLWRTILNGDAFRAVFTNVRKDGETYYEDKTISPILDASGAITHFVSAGRDVTYWREAERTLRESEERFRQLAENVDDVFWLIDVPTRRLLYVSPSFERVWGIPIADLRTRPRQWLETIRSDNKPDVLESMRRILDNGISTDDEFAIMRPDGSERWIRARAFAIRDASGAIVRIAGIATDITERRAAEEEIRRLSAVVEQTADVVMLLDPDGVIEYVNPAFEQKTGYAAFEAIGRLPETFIASSDERDNALLSDGMQYTIRRKSGDVYYEERSVSPIRDALGVLTHYAVVGKDVTEQRRREAAERASEAKSEFLNRMSHELRTPMHAVLGFGQLLRDDTALSERQTQRVDRILTAGGHLLELIDEVLDLSRIEAGRITVSPEHISLGSVVAEALATISPQANERDLRIDDQASYQELAVQADRMRLRQVLLNLLSNAVKFNRPSGSITLGAELADGGRVRVSISDTGPGIPAEHLATIFQPFERLAADSDRIQGTGIGLTISKKLVELMGGSIGVESVVSEGSTFWIELPVSTEEIPQREVVDTNTAGSQYVVLYVDDNPDSLALMEDILQDQRDIRLLTALGARLGLELAQAHRPDVILLDINMPDIDGFAALRALRAIPETAETPALALSASVLPGEVERGLNAGFERYIGKPIRVREFLEQLRRILSGRPRR